jgi:hypothetical protein
MKLELIKRIDVRGEDYFLVHVIDTTDYFTFDDKAKACALYSDLKSGKRKIEEILETCDTEKE